MGATAQTLSHKERTQQYILQYKDFALEEQRRCGIPAAITLGQGILETEAGKSELATQANNHFGIKCKKEWTGETFAHDDDAPQECFRKYPTALHSYRDHSDYLKSSKRYQPCFAQSPTDYAAWARELRKCGYATNPRYSQILIKIIEDYQLQDYTYAAMTPGTQPSLIASTASPVAATMLAEKAAAKEVVPEHDTPADNGDKPTYGQITRKDGVRGFYARKGDVLLEYAIQFKVRYAKLLEINNLPDAPLAAEMFVSLEKGSRITQIISRDAAAPTPVMAYANPARGEVLSTEGYMEKPAAIPAEEPVAVEKKKTRAPRRTEDPAPVVKKQQPEETPIQAKTEVRPAVVVTEQAKSTVPAASAPPVVVAAATPVPVREPAVAAPAPVKAINIANEKAVEEEIAKGQKEPEETDAAEEDKEAPAGKPEEPKDEFSRLKARLDKVVYAPVKKPTAAPAPAPPVTAPVAAPVVASSATADGKQYHTVKSGETAFGIARKYGVTMKELMAMNSLNFEAIKIGQRLRVK